MVGMYDLCHLESTTIDNTFICFVFKHWKNWADLCKSLGAQYVISWNVNKKGRNSPVLQVFIEKFWKALQFFTDSFLIIVTIF